ncbi:MAG: ATP-binding protein [Marmoricola sp.]
MNVAELRVPAESAYGAVLRMTTAGLAARLDFTLDDIEDLRMAVGEACALVLDHAAPDSELRCRYEMDEKRIRVTMSADGATGPDVDSFAWQVLNALADEVRAGDDGAAGPVVSFVVTSETA